MHGCVFCASPVSEGEAMVSAKLDQSGGAVVEVEGGGEASRSNELWLASLDWDTQTD